MRHNLGGMFSKMVKRKRVASPRTEPASQPRQRARAGVPAKRAGRVSAGVSTDLPADPLPPWPVLMTQAPEAAVADVPASPLSAVCPSLVSFSAGVSTDLPANPLPPWPVLMTQAPEAAVADVPAPPLSAVHEVVHVSSSPGRHPFLGCLTRRAGGLPERTRSPRLKLKASPAPSFLILVHKKVEGLFLIMKQA